MDSNAILRKVLKDREVRIISEVDLANRIRNLRESKGLSRMEFADKIKANKCSVWEWESRYKKPSRKSLERICAAFVLDISYFEVMD